MANIGAGLLQFSRLWNRAFGPGFSPIAPGTIGSIPGVICGVWVVDLPLTCAGFFGAFYFFISWWALGKELIFLKDTAGFSEDDQDQSSFVSDEVLGSFVSFLGCHIFFSKMGWGVWTIAGASFVLFRFFDILKRGPVGWVDRRIKGSFGILADDLVAALLAVSVAIAIAYFEGAV